ncbi:MAG: GNAT family N-acetyltransferase [Saprospiraceae bacterium]
MILPILETQRLTLRQLTEKDSPEILILRSDPEINQYLDRPLSKDEKDAEAFIQKVNSNIINDISLYWAITMTETKILLGTICLFSFDQKKKSCEIGYELLPTFQGGGIMFEACNSVIEFAFGVLGIEKITAYVHKDNQQSIKLVSKLHFVNILKQDPDCPELWMFSLDA